MPTNGSPSSSVRFGVFELNEDTGELRKAGRLVRIQRQPFKVLALLARNPGALISREQLRHELWKDETFVDFDQGLNFCVSHIRAVLGDRADSPRYIETLPRRGYRFIAMHAAEPARAPTVDSDATRSFQVLPRSADPSPPRWPGETFGEGGSAALSKTTVRPLWLRWAVVGVVLLLAAGAGVRQSMRGRSRASSAPVSVAAAAGLPADAPRLVVLPFENLTGRSADDWLAGAFSDTLTYGLQNLSGVILVNRERVAELFAQQGVPESRRLDARSVQALSHLFAARYYVYGSYQLVGDDVKVVARLVEADSGQIRAQESVTDRLANILRVEDDLARRFASSLEGGPLQAPSELTGSVEAYRAFIEARSLYANGKLEDALAKTDRAVSLDPKFAQAWAVMSKTYSRLTAPSTFTGGADAEYRRLAFEAAQRAVTIDPHLYDARTALALAHRENGRASEWRAEARSAIELNPRLAESYVLLGDSYFSAPGWGCGRDRDAALAERHYRRAFELDPRFALAYGNLAIHLVWAARPQEALSAVDAGLREIPVNTFLLQTRAYVLERLDRLDDAETQINEVLKTRNATVQDLTLLATIDLRRSNRARSARFFDEALSRRRDTTTELATARAHFDSNDVGGGLPNLEHALTTDTACVGWFQQSAAFAAARKNPQVEALVAKFQRASTYR